ncbi:Cof-type HAD-IIB family hydrolase [Pseudoclavibacter helvolus]|uniref:Cof-type HAD-IIB family hydrolase n=1 Tax=Pseudoclavibacter helvolus TaxID=255205 RepID=UPI003C74752C
MALFFSDIDGTLLSAQRTLSPRTIEAIRALRAAGHQFVLCSSRPPESMRVLERLYGGLGSPLVAYNGGLVLSGSGEVQHSVPIAPSDARFIAEHCEAAGLHASFFAGEHWYAWGEDTWMERERTHTWVHPEPRSTLEFVASGAVDATPPHKVMCMGDPALVDALEAALAGRLGVVSYRSKDTYLEIANADCSKGTGLLAVAEQLGVGREDLYYFGDNYNDLPAFEVVGHPIAVANARSEALAAARVVIPSNTDDGVAVFVEEWLAENAA